MKRNLLTLLTLLLLASVVLAACGGAATEAPAAPEEPAPAPTEVPATEEPAMPDFEGKSLMAESCDKAGIIQGVEATGQYEATFTLCQPDPAFLSKIAFSVYGIYPEEWIEATAGDETRSTEGLENPIGTGPYMVSEWNRGESITFTANPNYYGPAPEVETLVFRWSTESASRLLELQSGTVDAIDNVGPEDFDVVSADSSLSLQVRPALNVFYLAMTNTFAPFDNQAVRQAVAKGIDRQRIIDNFYPPGSEVASHFTPCAIPNGCAGDAWYDFDAETARAELAAAGFPDGFSTKIFYRDVVRGYLPNVSNVAQELQAQLKTNLNIDAEIVVMESGAFIEESTAGRLDGFYLLGWGADYPHVTNFLDFHFGAANPQFGVNDPSYADVLAEAAQIADPAESEPLYVEANNAIRNFVPMIPVAHGGSATAWRADVTNPQASPLSNEYFAVSDPGGRDVFVWMQNAEPISLFCADETDGESLRACEQIVEALYSYEVNGTAVEPALAESCEPNDTLDVWVCTLRQGVTFHDGSTFDANDVVATFTMGLDASSALHKGNTNAWEYYDYLWGLLNKPE
ncbi:MAG TPA: peptide ABC transporter substrate-binding protein [Anaerolineae bacterium]|nr:peptide ABC transporter substrate-binding protein [Anaerolineae bacterium]